MANPGTALIMGVGEGLGVALAKRFAAGGHAIAMVARDRDRLLPLADEISKTGAKVAAYSADTTDQDAVIAAFDQAETELGDIDVAIHNVNGRVVKSILEMEGPEFEGQWRAVCLGGMYVGREAAKRMVPRGAGSIFYTGGRGSRRAQSEFAAFAVAKFGARALAESMARELGPKGIHVAHFAIEATIAREPMLSRQPEAAAAEKFVDTAALAETFYQTHIQPRSCWSFEVDIRPWSEEFI